MRILINWDYTRQDLMEPFRNLKEQFDFVFLYNYENDQNQVDLEFERVYWNEYESPYKLLEKIKPDKLIFHDIESFHQVALNLAAKNQKIPTFVLEHGLRGKDEIEIAYKHSIEKTNSNKKETTEKQKTQESRKGSFNTLKFYLKAFTLSNFDILLPFLVFIYYRKKFGLTIGLHKYRHKFRQADRYINFTETNAVYIFKRDNVRPGKFVYIGNPFLDKYFRNDQVKNIITESFYLLIDSPFVEDEVFNMEAAEKNLFYEKINSFCKNNEAKLYIKLHPKSFNSSYLPQDNNIVYYRNCDLKELLLSAKGTMVIHMTALFPLITYYSKSIFFNAYPRFNKEVTEAGVVPVLDFFEFKPEEIKFEETDFLKKEAIIFRFLYKADGRAEERLREVLLNFPLVENV